MTSPMPQAPINADPSLRDRPVLDVLPYGSLVFCVLLLVSFRSGSSDKAEVAGLVLSGLSAAWMLWMYTLHPAWRSRPRLMAVFITVLIVLGALLILDNTIFGIYTFTIYFFVIRYLVWPWRLLGSAAIGLLQATSQAYGVNKDTAGGILIYLIIIVVNVAIALAFTWSRWLNVRAFAELSESNRKLEASLAENAGLQQQLLTQAREAGVLDERQRMAREIHDTLAQGLTGIITQLQAAEQAADDPPGWRRHFEAATRLARDSLSEARRSVEALRPESLETGRLSEALAEVTGRWSALHGIPAQVTTTGTARSMPPEAEFALLRTAQEALANVAKHAHATRVGVTLSYMEHEVALDVRDDGRGFDLAQLCTEAAKAAKAKAAKAAGKTNGHASVAHANGVTGLVGLSVADGLRHPAAGKAGKPDDGGFGLVSMRQRIESLAGTLQVESEPGFGTGISACLPVASAEARS
ncbi:MAG TPA: sensor histidine kinase [Streptosporangiaceae bacterium]|nr:sensor histidine kinase [Streptosporangiaceae bacterium]